MSTKTFFRRIALWAIVAMGAGFLGSAPASAASNPNATISATCVMRSGVGGFITVSGAGWWTDTTNIRWTSYSYTLNSGAAYTQSTAVNYSRRLAVSSDSSSATMVIPLNGGTAGTESAASQLASQVWTVWADLDGANTSSAGADDPSVAVTCTDAGAPTKFGISGATTATAGDTVTYTVTPQNASGATTILRPDTESFTVKLTPAAGRAKLYAGRATGSTGTTIIPGAGLADTAASGTVAPGTLPVNGIMQSTWGHTLVAGMPFDTMYYGGGTAAFATITLQGKHADAAPTYRSLAATGASSTAAGGAHSESATSTGAFTVRGVVDSNTTATFLVEGAGALANSISGSATLTTAPQVYGTSYGFGSSSASVVAGYGITKGTTGWNAGAPGITSPTAATPTGGIDATAATTQTIKVSTARTSIPLTVQLSQAGTFTYTVAAVVGFALPTGVTAGTYTTTSATGVETQTAITITTTAPVAGQRFTVAFTSAANYTHTVTMLYEAPQVGTSIGASVALTDTSSSMKVAVGGTVMGEVTVRDQYGSLVNGASCNWTISGRNPTAAAVTNTTGANGTATYSWTDADSTKSVTTYATDTLGVTCTSGNSGTYLAATSAAYTWVASLTATAITASNNGATTGTAANGSVTVTITVTDSTGAGLSGYPVTVSTDSKSFALTTGATSRTAYTNSSGVASATVYAKTIGTSVVTVTSGGKSTTSSYLIIAGSARTIALDATTATMAPGETKFLTATVKDSFGNVVDAQSVTVTYTGTAGRVVSLNGVSASTGTTDENGKLVIGLSGDAAGTGTLTLTFTGGDASTATLNDGSARPTRVASITAAVTIAGKSSTVTAVEAAQAAADAATDAALEAIDAANAATDAANLAAEAADAATVAAEEARDAADAATAAVEALATEVATLMAALKAQITTLANTVAKIAKKVKA